MTRIKTQDTVVIQTKQKAHRYPEFLYSYHLCYYISGYKRFFREKYNIQHHLTIFLPLTI